MALAFSGAYGAVVGGSEALFVAAVVARIAAVAHMPAAALTIVLQREPFVVRVATTTTAERDAVLQVCVCVCVCVCVRVCT